MGSSRTNNRIVHLAVSASIALGLLLSIPFARSAEPSFLESLRKSYAILSSPEVPPEVKGRAIDDLFAGVSAACQKSCPAVLSSLRAINKQVQSEDIRSLLSSLPKDVATTLHLSPEQINEVSSRLQNYLGRVDPIKLQYQIQASSELLRFIVSIEEESLIKLPHSSASEREQGMKQLQDDILQFKRQAMALMDLMQFSRDMISAPEKSIDVQRVVKDIDDLGLFYMKLAQSVSNLHLLPKEITEGFKGYQDDVKQLMTPEEVEKIIQEDLGKSSKEVFVDFDPTQPLKCGTVACTYKAKIKTLFGLKEVVVKIRRSGLERQLEWNRKINTTFFKVGNIFIPENMSWILHYVSSAIDGLEDAIQGEFDFRIEAKNLIRFRKTFTFFKGVKIPEVYKKQSSKRILTMEKLPGDNIERALEMTKEDGTSELDLKVRMKWFSTLLDSFLYQTIVTGDLHADQHPGNILGEETGNLGLVDFGQTFRTRGLVSAPARLFFNLFQGDAVGFSRAFQRLGAFPNDDAAARFQTAVEGVFKDHKLGLLKMSEVVKGLFGEGRFENSMMSLKEIFILASKDHGFIAKPTYLQFFRSAAPAGSTLLKLGKGIPPEKMKSFLIWKTLEFAPKGAVAYVGSRPLLLMDWVGQKASALTQCFTRSLRGVQAQPE